MKSLPAKEIPYRLVLKFKDLLARCGFSSAVVWRVWGVAFAQEDYQRRIFPQHDWLLKRIEVAKPASLLEVGCGFGRNLSFLRQNSYFGGRASGLDLSGSMLRQAERQYGIPRNRLHRGRAEKLPFASQSFDLTFTMGLSVHISSDFLEQLLL